MFWRLRRTAAILGLLPAIAAANTGLIQVTGVRSWSHTDSTRVIVETSGPIEFKSDRANSPDRLFFDILHARPWLQHRRLAVYQINDNLVRRVRVAETSPGTTRIVFDLVGAAEFEVSTLDSPDRMVIELRPAGARNTAREYAGRTHENFASGADSGEQRAALCSTGLRSSGIRCFRRPAPNR